MSDKPEIEKQFTPSFAGRCFQALLALYGVLIIIALIDVYFVSTPRTQPQQTEQKQ